MARDDTIKLLLATTQLDLNTDTLWLHTKVAGGRILERCQDVDPSVSAAALRCACDLATAEVLKEVQLSTLKADHPGVWELQTTRDVLGEILNLDGYGFVLQKRHNMSLPSCLTCQEDYIRITDLVWDPDARRRDAACVFACRFVMQEDSAWGLGPLRGLQKSSPNCKGHHGPAQRKCGLRSQKAGIFRR